MAAHIPAHLEGISSAGIPLANPGDRHTRRDSNPLAHDLFQHGVAHLPLPDRRFVLAALEAAQFNAHATPQVQIHRNAMRDCLRVHRKLTRPIWEAYRLEHDPHEEVLQPAGEVAEMLGGGNWTAAVEIVTNGVVPDPTALRLTGVGDEPTLEELCELLRECATWLDRDYFGPKDYRTFEEAMDGVERDGPPLVKSYTFQRRFGTFALARKAAGLLTPTSPHRAAATATASPTVRSSCSARPRRSSS